MSAWIKLIHGHAISKMKNRDFYRFIGWNRIHYDYKYKPIGEWNILRGFEYNGECVPGGFYITTVEHLQDFKGDNCILAKVELPLYSPFFRCVELPKKWRVNALKITEEYDLTTAAGLEFYKKLTLNTRINKLKENPEVLLMGACMQEKVDLFQEIDRIHDIDHDTFITYSIIEGKLEMIKSLINQYNASYWFNQAIYLQAHPIILDIIYKKNKSVIHSFDKGFSLQNAIYLANWKAIEFLCDHEFYLDMTPQLMQKISPEIKSILEDKYYGVNREEVLKLIN